MPSKITKDSGENLLNNKDNNEIQKKSKDEKLINIIDTVNTSSNNENVINNKVINNDETKLIKSKNNNDLAHKIDKNVNVLGNYDIKKNKTKNSVNKSKAKKAFTIISWVLSVLLFVIVLIIIILLSIGYKPAVVLTPSMTPTIMPGDMVVYKKVDVTTIKEEDIITFWSSNDSKENDGVSVTHRVVDIIDDGDGTISFQTKGDNNDSVDSKLVPQELVIGKVVFVVPWFGRLFLFVKNNLFVIIFSIISIILIYYLVKMFRNKDENDDEQQKKLDNSNINSIQN